MFAVGVLDLFTFRISGFFICIILGSINND